MESSNDEWSVIGQYRVSDIIEDRDELESNLVEDYHEFIDTSQTYTTMEDAIMDQTDSVEFPNPDNMTDEERTEYEMQLWAHAQRGGRDG